MIKIKNILAGLAAIGLATSSASLVVSCGPSFSDLKNRQIDPSVFKTTFNNNIQNWNMAATMQSNDFKILANTQDTLMTYNNDSDLLDPEPLLLDGKPTSDDSKTWTLKLKEGAKWFSFDGKEVGDITAQDIKNTGLYALDSKNGSELSADWRTFVGDKITDENVKVDPNDPKTLKITLKSPSKFFPTALTTGSFAPTPDIALQMGYDYGRGINYNKTLLSGPYYVDSYKNSYELVLKRNKNYKINKEKNDSDSKNTGSVNTIKYFYSQTTDSGKIRTMFETGDANEALISPSDSYGYRHYVNGNFDGLEKVDNELIGSKYLWYNFAKQHVNGNSPEITNEDLKSNKALSFDSVRTLIAYGLDRSILVKYFAGSKDPKVLNDFIVNTFNPSGYLKTSDGKDYTSSITTKIGNNAFYHNDDLLSNYGGTFEGLINQVKKDVGSKQITLKFLTSGANATTFNPYIREMLDDFNLIKESPIKIEEEATADDAAYQQAQLDGNYSMFITGETPTYIDPMSFLVNLQPNGPMNAYDGMSRLFNADGKLNDANVKKYGVVGNLTGAISKYNKLLNDASGVSDNDTRYTNFAKAEKNILFDAKTILPLYKPNGKYTYNLSYMKYSTRPNKGFGYQDYRLDKVQLAHSIQELIDSNELNKTDTKNKSAITKQY